MRNFPKRLSLLISVLLVSLLSVTASGTEAAFEDSATAQVTGTAAKISAVTNGGDAMYPGFFYWEAVQIDTPMKSSISTITNNGTLDGNFSILIDSNNPSIAELNQSEVFKHTNIKVWVGGSEVYNGPISQMKTKSVRINVGETKDFNTELSIVYSPALDASLNLGYKYSSVPILGTFTPADAPNSTWTISTSSSISYTMAKWKVTEEDVTIAGFYADDRCIDVDLNYVWPTNDNYTFKYSKNSDMSNASSVTNTRLYIYAKGLSINTKYYYQILANKSVKPTWSDVYSFTTGSKVGQKELSCVGY